MTFNLSMRKKLVGLGVAATVLVSTGGAVAWAQGGSGSARDSTASVGEARPAIQAVARRAVHGDLVVKDKDGAYVTVTFDRGTVSSASATSITVDRPDGQQVTLTVDADTKVHGKASAAEVETGKAAIVVSRTGTATQILQRANA